MVSARRWITSIGLLLLTFAIQWRTQSPPADLVLTGEVKGAQNKTYFEVPFAVPTGTHRISVDFHYTGKEDRATLDLGIADPGRFRGASGGNKSHFTISETDATPSYLPVAIPAGKWRLLIAVGLAGIAETFIMHTAHSDGSCPSQSGRKVPCPLLLTVQTAATRGLDFIAITDHNATSEYDAMRDLQQYFDRVLLIPGREMTTFKGRVDFGRS